jgi:hypothetical protein
VHVDGGGQADLSQAESYTWSLCAQNQIFSAMGEGSVLDLSGLLTLSTDVPDCEAIQSSIFVSTGGHIDLSGLGSTEAPGDDQFSFVMLSGGTLGLANLVSMDGVFANIGADTLLALPALTSLSHSTLLVTLGGGVEADALLNAHDVLFSPSGVEAISVDALVSTTFCQLNVPQDSTWTLPSLSSVEDTSISLPNGAQLSMPMLETMGATAGPAFFSASGTGAVSAPMLREVSNVAFVVSQGAVLALPSVEEYTWSLCEDLLPFSGSGAASTLDLSGLRSFRAELPGCSVPNLSVTANAGTRIDLSGLQSVVAPGVDSITFLSSGTDSVIDLSSLATYSSAQVLFFEMTGGRILRFSGPVGPGAQCHAAPGAPFFGESLRCDLLVVIAVAFLMAFAWKRPART